MIAVNPLQGISDMVTGNTPNACCQVTSVEKPFLSGSWCGNGRGEHAATMTAATAMAMAANGCLVRGHTNRPRGRTLNSIMRIARARAARSGPPRIR
jgi:hypothetical protein